MISFSVLLNLIYEPEIWNVGFYLGEDIGVERSLVNSDGKAYKGEKVSFDGLDKLLDRGA